MRDNVSIDWVEEAYLEENLVEILTTLDNTSSAKITAQLTISDHERTATVWIRWTK